MTDDRIEVSVTAVIPAPPATVYAMISDPARLAELSPENVEGRWLGGATRATVGARFQGRNAVGSMRWSTKPVVTEAEPGRRFAFRVPSGARSNWTYELEPVGGGTRVIESVRTERAVPGLITWFMRRAGIDNRTEHLRQGMTTTLDRLAAAV